MPVPILRLPHLAFENIYRHWKIAEIILLSQCSKRTKTVVKFMEKRRESALEVRIDTTEASVSVITGYKTVFQWMICLNSNSVVLAHAQDFVDMTFEGQPWSLARKAFNFPNWLSLPRADGIEQDVLFIVQFLQALLQSPIAKIHVMSLKNMSFDKFFRSSSILQTASVIDMTYTECSPLQMSFIFENLNAEKLRFTGRSLFYQKPVLRFPNIQLINAQWVTAKDFMRMVDTCKKIKLCRTTKISEDHLNKFVKKWLEGSYETLEQVEVSREGVGIRGFLSIREPFNKDVILNGVEFRRVGREVEVCRNNGKAARMIFDQGGYYSGRFKFFVL